MTKVKVKVKPYRIMITENKNKFVYTQFIEKCPSLKQFLMV